MKLTAGQLRSPLRFFTAICLLLLLPFIGITPRAAAMEEHSAYTHQNDMDVDCATACARTAIAPPTQAIINENETRAPDPAPQESIPYHLQFQLHAPRVQRPNPLYATSPSKPPDIVKMSGHFRL